MGKHRDPNDTSYLGNQNLKTSGVPVNYTQEQVEEYIKCTNDPVYFIEKYIKIVNVDQGLVDFNLYEYQKNMVNAVHNNRFVIAKLPRQSGKSTTVISYILHFILFNPSVNVAILANKLATARELLGRLRMSYEHLPKWLQQGIVEWNKGSIILENGSKVLASATSSSAVRGGSFNMIFMDEFAYVPHGVAEDFFSSVYPTISSGQTTKVLIVSTPRGLNMYYKMWTDAVEGNNSYFPIEVHWSDVPGRNEKWKQQTIANTSEEQFRVEFECDFIGSVNTLINSAKLKSLAFVKPLVRNDDGLRIYEHPQKGHTYFIGVDVSRGLGKDNHAFTVIDLNADKGVYKVVAAFSNNTMPPMVFPTAVHAIAKQYNDAYVLVEVNDIGGQVADIIHNEFEYDNLLSCSFRGRKGQVLDGGFGSGKPQLGIRTTIPLKKIGCSNLKSIIEGDKLLIQDYDIINELVSFVAKYNSYEADAGHTDDLVMSLVFFAWAVTQEFFKNLTDKDIRQDLFKERLEQIEEDMLPLGFFDGGIEEEYEKDSDGRLWKDADKNNPWGFGA